MNLSPDQKKWCSEIYTGTIIDPLTFLLHENIIRESTSPETSNIVEVFTLIMQTVKNDGTILKRQNCNRYGDFYEFTYTKAFETKIKEFLSLIIYLRDNHLVILYKSIEDYQFELSEQKLKTPSDDENENKQLRKFLFLINNAFSFKGLRSKEYIPYLSLFEFIENGYKSDKELEFEAQKDAYEKQREHNKKTFWISISALILSFFTAVGSNIFTYCTYTKERKVEIINLDSALVKVSRSPLYRGGAQDSLSKIPSPSAVVARDGKNTGK